MKKYDIFISYRREGGYETAKHLFDLLDRDGFSVSFDIDTLRNGDFDTDIFRIIDGCKDFIIILSPGIFDRCVKTSTQNDDWVRKELAYALKRKKNIIPIMLKGFEGFPSDLPADIAGIARKNAVIYEMHYFNAFYEKLKKDFLGSHSRKTWVVPVIAAAIVAVVLAWFVVGNGVLHFEDAEAVSLPEWLFADEPGYICIVPPCGDNDNEASEILPVIYAAYQWVIDEGKPVSEKDTMILGKYRGSIQTQDKLYFDFTVNRSMQMAGGETASRISVAGAPEQSSSASSFIEIFRYRMFEEVETEEGASSAMGGQVRNYITGQIKGVPFVLETTSIRDNGFLKLWLNGEEVMMPFSGTEYIDGGKFIALDGGMAIDIENISSNEDLSEYGSISRFWASLIFDQFAFSGCPLAEVHVKTITDVGPDGSKAEGGIYLTDDTFLEPYCLVLNGIKDGKVSFNMRLDKEREQQCIQALEYRKNEDKLTHDGLLKGLQQM